MLRFTNFRECCYVQGLLKPIQQGSVAVPYACNWQVNIFNGLLNNGYVLPDQTIPDTSKILSIALSEFASCPEIESRINVLWVQCRLVSVKLCSREMVMWSILDYIVVVQWNLWTTWILFRTVTPVLRVSFLRRRWIVPTTKYLLAHCTDCVRMISVVWFWLQPAVLTTYFLSC